MTTETFPAQVRSALLVGVLAGRERLSITEQRRFRALAWQVCPCTCGSGPDGEGHTAWCLNGYGAQTPEPLPPELLKRLAARVDTDDNVEVGARILHDAHGGDLEECREDVAAILTAAGIPESDTNERTDMPDYPHPDGDTTVLGPEIFAAHDGSVICWRGQNYVLQETPDVPEAADDA